MNRNSEILIPIYQYSEVLPDKLPLTVAPTFANLIKVLADQRLGNELTRLPSQSESLANNNRQLLVTEVKDELDNLQLTELSRLLFQAQVDFLDTPDEELDQDFIEQLTRFHWYQLHNEDTRTMTVVDQYLSDLDIENQTAQSIKEFTNYDAKVKYKSEWGTKFEPALVQFYEIIPSLSSYEMVAHARSLYEYWNGKKLTSNSKKELDSIYDGYLNRSLEESLQLLVNNTNPDKNTEIIANISELQLACKDYRSRFSEQHITELIDVTVTELGQSNHGLPALSLLIAEKETELLRSSDHTRRKILIPAFSSKPNPDYLDDIMQFGSSELLNEIGLILHECSSNQENLENTLTQYLDNNPNSVLQHQPLWLVSRLCDVFETVGYAKRKNDGYTLKNASANRPLGYDSLRGITLAKKAIDIGLQTETPGQSVGNLVAMYREHKNKITVPEILLKASEGKVLYLPDLRIGSSDVDMDYIQQLLESLKDNTPDTVVISDPIQGSFHFTDKPMRGNLVTGLEGTNAQFEAAKSIIDTFEKWVAKL